MSNYVQQHPTSVSMQSAVIRENDYQLALAKVGAEVIGAISMMVVNGGSSMSPEPSAEVHEDAARRISSRRQDAQRQQVATIVFAAVLPEQRGQGVMGRLLHRVKRWCLDAGYHLCILSNVSYGFMKPDEHGREVLWNWWRMRGGFGLDVQPMVIEQKNQLHELRRAPSFLDAHTLGSTLFSPWPIDTQNVSLLFLTSEALQTSIRTTRLKPEPRPHHSFIPLAAGGAPGHLALTARSSCASGGSVDGGSVGEGSVGGSNAGGGSAGRGGVAAGSEREVAMETSGQDRYHDVREVIVEWLSSCMSGNARFELMQKLLEDTSDNKRALACKVASSMLPPQSGGAPAAVSSSASSPQRESTNILVQIKLHSGETAQVSIAPNATNKALAIATEVELGRQVTKLCFEGGRMLSAPFCSRSTCAAYGVRNGSVVHVAAKPEPRGS